MAPANGFAGVHLLLLQSKEQVLPIGAPQVSFSVFLQGSLSQSLPPSQGDAWLANSQSFVIDPSAPWQPFGDFQPRGPCHFVMGPNPHSQKSKRYPQAQQN